MGRRDHQMNIERLRGMAPQRADRGGPHGDVRHEMAVHHVDMDPVGAGGIDRAHLLAEPREIRGEDRRRNEQRTAHGGLRNGLRLTWRATWGNAVDSRPRRLRRVSRRTILVLRIEQ